MDCFERLERGLAKQGLIEDARWLRELSSVPYTTSSELLGEYGVMVRRIYRVIPIESREALRGLFTECERAVREAWPHFKLATDL